MEKESRMSGTESGFGFGIASGLFTETRAIGFSNLRVDLTELALATRVVCS